MWQEPVITLFMLAALAPFEASAFETSTEAAKINTLAVARAVGGEASSSG
jgi:hypothetical protein